MIPTRRFLTQRPVALQSPVSSQSCPAWLVVDRIPLRHQTHRHEPQGRTVPQAFRSRSDRTTTNPFCPAVRARDRRPTPGHERGTILRLCSSREPIR